MMKKRSQGFKNKPVASPNIGSKVHIFLRSHAWPFEKEEKAFLSQVKFC